MLNYDLFKEKIHELKGIERNIPPRIIEIEEYIKRLLIGKDSVDDLLITDIDIDYITEDDIRLIENFKDNYGDDIYKLCQILSSLKRMDSIFSNEFFV